MKVRAKVSGLKISPRKLGLVAGLVRLRRVADALTILEHTPKRGAGMLASAIKSAQANAENNLKLKAENLFVGQILVGPGPILKRFRPAPMGRAHRLNYRSSNLTVVLDELSPPVGKTQAVKSKAKAKR